MVLLPPGWSMVQPPLPGQTSTSHAVPAPMMLSAIPFDSDNDDDDNDFFDGSEQENYFDDSDDSDDDDDEDGLVAILDDEEFAALVRGGRHAPSADRRLPPATLAEALRLAPERERRDTDTMCSVCQDSEHPELYRWRELPCGHAYHSNCALTALLSTRRCPLCRADILSTRSPPRNTTVAVAADDE